MSSKTPNKLDRVNSGDIQLKSTNTHTTKKISLIENHIIDDYQDIDDEKDEAPDFNDILKMSECVGGHFMFNSEKNWTSKSDELSSLFRKYFKLDSSSLNDYMSSIPFHERIQFNIEFTEEEIKKMDDTANTNFNLREIPALKETTTDKNSEQKRKPYLQRNSVQNIGTSNALPQQTESNFINTEKTIAISTPTVSENNLKDNMQQWLDDILDI